jgi:hypothetical protein
MLNPFELETLLYEVVNTLDGLGLIEGPRWIEYYYYIMYLICARIAVLDTYMEAPVLGCLLKYGRLPGYLDLLIRRDPLDPRHLPGYLDLADRRHSPDYRCFRQISFRDSYSS